MRRAPVPSATGEHPCAAQDARTPPFQPPYAIAIAHCVTPRTLGSCSWHGSHSLRNRSGSAPPSTAHPGRSRAAVVRGRTRLGRRAGRRRLAGAAADGTALRRTAAARPGRLRSAAATRGRAEDRSGRAGGGHDAAPGGRRHRGRTARSPGLAAVGSAAARSDRRRHRRPDSGAAAARLVGPAGSRRVGAAPEPGCEVEPTLPTSPDSGVNGRCPKAAATRLPISYDSSMRRQRSATASD